jgi:hypothetical protein
MTNRKLKVLYFFYGVAGLLAAISIGAALSEDPDGTLTTGSYAAITLLFVTSIALGESVRHTASVARKTIGAVVGLGVMSSAYLWVADELEVHPLDLQLLGALGIVWLLGAVLMAFIFVFVVAAMSDG